MATVFFHDGHPSCTSSRGLCGLILLGSNLCVERSHGSFKQAHFIREYLLITSEKAFISSLSAVMSDWSWHTIKLGGHPGSRTNRRTASRC